MQKATSEAYLPCYPSPQVTQVISKADKWTDHRRCVNARGVADIFVLLCFSPVSTTNMPQLSHLGYSPSCSTTMVSSGWRSLKCILIALPVEYAPGQSTTGHFTLHNLLMDTQYSWGVGGPVICSGSDSGGCCAWLAGFVWLIDHSFLFYKHTLRDWCIFMCCLPIITPHSLHCTFSNCLSRWVLPSPVCKWLKASVDCIVGALTPLTIIALVFFSFMCRPTRLNQTVYAWLCNFCHSPSACGLLPRKLMHIYLNK
jgi:hypothetical protein